MSVFRFFLCLIFCGLTGGALAQEPPAKTPEQIAIALNAAGLALSRQGDHDLALASFGNRVPQFSFEVMRAAQGPGAAEVTGLADAVRGFALIPGTGHFPT